MRCPNCYYSNRDDASFCAKCGTALPNTVNQHDDSNKSLIIIVLIFLLAIVSLFAVYSYIDAGLDNPSIPDTKPSNSQINTIDATQGFPVSEVDDLAMAINQNGYDFDSVDYKGVKLTKAQCLYILSVGIVRIDQGNNANIDIKNIGNAPNPSGYIKTVTISKSIYVDVARRTANWMDNKGSVPNHTGIYQVGSGDLSPDTLLRLFVNILVDYSSSGSLPSQITI